MNKRKLLEMDLHETKTFTTEGTTKTKVTVLRVYNGWIYNFYDGNYEGIFVPQEINARTMAV